MHISPLISCASLVQNCHCDVCTGKKKAEKTGVAWVAEGTKQRYLEPTKLLRNERHVKK